MKLNRQGEYASLLPQSLQSVEEWTGVAESHVTDGGVPAVQA